MADSPQSYVGKTIGEFRILDKIGEGAMGTVFKAVQSSLDREVALKVLHPRLIKKNPSFVERFLREAKTAAQINHPNIVQVYAAGKDKGVYFIAMEFVRGMTLLDVLGKHGRLPESKALALVLQAARGLAAGEKKNLIHRDIKSENLLLTSEGVVKVADFGLAKDLESASMVTHDGQIMGTPAFMSPEQARSQPVDSRSDIYSLGVTLFHVLTGEVPFKGENALSTMLKHLDGPVPDPREYLEDISEYTLTLLQKMMAKAPEDRFQTFQELVQVLKKRPQAQGEMEGMPPSRFPEGREPSGGIRSRHPTSDTLAGLVLTGTRSWLRIAGASFLGAAALAAILWFSGVFGGGPKANGPGPDEPDAGGTGPRSSVHLLVDSPADGAFLDSRDVEIRGSIEGVEVSEVTVDGIRADLDGGSFTLRLRLDDEGPRDIRVVAGGEKGGIETVLHVTVDTIAPVIRLTGIEAGQAVLTNRVEFQLDGQAEDDHLKRVEIDGTSLSFGKDGGFSTNLSLDTPEERIVTLQATDLAGNSQTLAFRLRLDSEVPEIELVAPAQGEAWGDPDQLVEIRFSEPVRNVRMGGALVPEGEEGRYTFRKTLAEGDNEIVVEADDLAGNAAKAAFTIRYSRFTPAELAREETAWATVQTVLARDGGEREKIAALEGFIGDHEGGKHIEEASLLLAELKAALEIEQRAFEQTCMKADAAAGPHEKVKLLEAFIAAHPSGNFTGEAEAKLEAILAEAIPLKTEGVKPAAEPGFFVNLKDGALMVFVEPGRFEMGRADGAPEDGPATSCELDGFYMYVHEVTNTRFAAFLAALGRDTDEHGNPLVLDSTKAMDGSFPWGLATDGEVWKPVHGFEDHPAIFVTWYGARAYARWAGCAIPTEAQWERCARGMSDPPFPWGDAPPGNDRANIGKSVGMTSPVGRFPGGASPARCLDMTGNVLEWCLDTYHAGFLKDVVPRRRNPFGDGDGEKSLRGGSWFHPASFGRTSCRQVHLDPAGAFPTVGFRCVKE